MVKTMDQKVCLITGGTSGIGAAIARGLAAEGHHVIITGRNRKRGDKELATILKVGGTGEALYGDLSNQSEVRRIAAEVRDKYDHLDVLIHNAGAVFGGRTLTEDGFEMSFALNHLAPFLLTHELWTVLAARGSRVITLSSDAHWIGYVPWDNLTNKGLFLGFLVYSQTKLMNILFSNELARRGAKDGIVSNAVNPGIVASGFAGNNRGFLKLITLIFAVVGTTPAIAAVPIVRLADDPSFADFTGLYWVGGSPASSSPLAKNEDDAKRLWDESATLTGVTTWQNQLS